MSCGIYKITNKNNGKSYIGQSIVLEQRIRSHKIRYHTSSDSGYYGELYSDMREQGLENFCFDIIEECPEELLDEREEYWISYYDSYKNGYNSTYGGKNYRIDHDEVMRLYNTGRYTNQEIAELVGAERRVIGTIIKKHNKKAHYYISEEEIEAMCDLYINKHTSILKLSELYNRDPGTISRALKSKGIIVKPCSSISAKRCNLFDKDNNLILNNVTINEIAQYLNKNGINAIVSTIRDSVQRGGKLLYRNYHVEQC